MTLWLLLTAHFIADFYLQSADWAEKKTQKVRYLLGHAFVYGVVLTLAAFACLPAGTAWYTAGIIALSHLVIDWLRVHADRRYATPVFHFSSFAADQALHIGVICGLVWGFSRNGENNGWFADLAAVVPLEQILRYVLIFTVLLDPAAVFVKKLSIYVSGGTNGSGQKKEPPVGRVIGKLERVIIAILVICGEIGAIGFVLTAKSLARYKQLNEQGFAEKYLVGTLSSTAIAIIVTLLLK